MKGYVCQDGFRGQVIDNGHNSIVGKVGQNQIDVTENLNTGDLNTKHSKRETFGKQTTESL